MMEDAEWANERVKKCSHFILREMHSRTFFAFQIDKC